MEMDNALTDAVALLHTAGLTCIRDERVLFQDLALTVAPGEVLVIEGANGSGKTSLLRILCGLSDPAAGVVYWCGEALPEARSIYYRALLYHGHYPGIKAALSPRENLNLAMRLAGGTARGTPVAALERLGLAGYEDLPCRTLSAGQQRRVALARLLLTEARLWILDEPFTAMDRRGRDLVEHLLEEHTKGGGAAILTTHQPLGQLDAAMTRLTIGHQGGLA